MSLPTMHLSIATCYRRSLIVQVQHTIKTLHAKKHIKGSARCTCTSHPSYSTQQKTLHATIRDKGLYETKDATRYTKSWICKVRVKSPYLA